MSADTDDDDFRQESDHSGQQPRHESDENSPGRGLRPTRDELEERITFTSTLLARRLYKGEIKAILKKKYGVTARSCERYLARARQRLIRRTGRSAEVHRGESVGFYESIIRNPESTLREKMSAQERIDFILGLGSAMYVVKGDKDSPLSVEVVEVVVTSRAEASGEVPAVPEAGRVS